MTNDYYFLKETTGVWWSATSTYAAGMALFPFPMKVTSGFWKYIKNDKKKEHMPNRKDWGYLTNGKKLDGTMELEGPMYNDSMMYYGNKGCTTYDNLRPASAGEDPPTTAAAGVYTHIYDTTEARTNPAPVFYIVIKMVNDEAASANDQWTFLKRAFIMKREIWGDVESGLVYQKLYIGFMEHAYSTTAVTTLPYFEGSLDVFKYEQSAVSFTKGGVEYAGICHAWKIIWDEHTKPHKGPNEQYAQRAMNGWREIEVWIDRFLVRQNEVWRENEEDDPTTDDDKDITITLTRTTNTDYIRYAFEKVWCFTNPDFDWYDDYTLETTNLGFIYKPTEYESGGQLHETEVNALDDDRYET